MSYPADKLDVVIVGGGMITHDQILPSLYHLQRLGRIGAITICALNSAPLRRWPKPNAWARRFRARDFKPCPT